MSTNKIFSLLFSQRIKSGCMYSYMLVWGFSPNFGMPIDTWQVLSRYLDKDQPTQLKLADC